MIELPLDVWYKVIVDHLECDRKSLLSLVLVSRSLSQLALDILWREQASLRPFYSVINSSSLSHSPGWLILAEEGGVKDEWGAWFVEPSLSLREPLNDTVCRRVQVYLSRIQKLKVKLGCPWVSSMLTLLTTCVEFNDPILPNLKHLQFSYSASADIDSSQIYPLMPLLSSPLQSIDFRILKFQSQAVVTVFNLLIASRREIEQLRYTGPDHPELFSALRPLTFLRSLSTSHPEGANRTVTAMSAPEFVSLFSSLHCLSLDLGAFPLLKNPSSTIHTFLTLEDLRLYGTTQDLQNFLREARSNSVRKVSLAFRDQGAHSVSYKACFEHLRSAFPDTSALHLEFHSERGSPCLYYPALTPLLRMKIESFSLFQVSGAISFKLTKQDLGLFVEAWPRLQHFSLLSWSAPYDPDILRTFSRLCHLRKLEIFLNLSPLYTSSFTGHDNRSKQNSTSTSSCPLEELNLDDARYLPVNTGKADILVTHLLELFPDLRVVSLGSEACFLQERLNRMRA